MITRITAFDQDGDVLGYSITQGNEANKFTINSLSGDIIVAAGLDRETVPEYDLLIQASDGVNVGTTMLRVTVTDVNDESPEFQQQQYVASIEENSVEGTLVLPFLSGSSVLIQAVDGDQPNTLNSIVRYRLTGTNAPRFNIDASRGTVTVARGTF